ncbi:MAG: hypothetical protein JJE55_15060 [Flavobacteriaceae bacterium]|nr:hypothetical protein [Flavobacteriaceae bacterium]
MFETRKRTDFLFPKRNFWTGFSSILDIFGADKKFNTSKSGREADTKAIQNDWEMIGQDFRDVLSKLT